MTAASTRPLLRRIGTRCEVKLSDTVNDTDVAHLVWLRGELGDCPLDTLVIYTGKVAYRRRDGVGVIPLALLGP